MDKDKNLEGMEKLNFNYNDGSKISLYELLSILFKISSLSKLCSR